MNALAPLLLLTPCLAFAEASTDFGKRATQRLADDELLETVQRRTFGYFWDGAEPNSGLARERYHVDAPEVDQYLVTTGGSGFGVMGLIAAMERDWIGRADGLERFERIANALESADRFHGAWPHWFDGRTGTTIPFSPKDNGADLVETAFLAQGLLCARQYFAEGAQRERTLSARFDQLWRDIEWTWFQKDESPVLYWHWSPTHEWAMNHPIQGYNECFIVYILAAASPTRPIAPELYHSGWARGGAIRNPKRVYGRTIDFEHNGATSSCGPLFWAHYSFLGLDPRGLQDEYANYWTHNRNHTLAHFNYCVENPKNFKGYGPDLWGLTSSYSPQGYASHQPGAGDLGVIAPTAALASMPYTPTQSQRVLQRLYYELGDHLWGPFGFYDAFSLEKDWFPKKYLAIDQGPIVVMIENYRTGLFWNLFMSCPEIQDGLRKLGFKNY